MFGFTRENTLRSEMDRRKSVRLRLLAAFKHHRVLTTADLRAYGTGVSSRIFELRQDGHRIGAVYQAPGLYKYVYRGKKAVKK